MRVETWQQRQSDAGDLGGSGNSCRHLRRICIGRAVAIVMEIVEFPDPRIALLEHLDIEQRRDRLGVLRSHLQREAIHRLAPRPERIRRFAARLCKSCHTALERVTVQARYSGDRQLVAFIVAFGRCADRNLFDGPIRDNHAHVVSPARRQQRRCKMQARHVFSRLDRTRPRLYV